MRRSNEDGHPVLALTARHDPQRIVRQRPLQFESLGRIGREPKIDFLRLRRITGMAMISRLTYRAEGRMDMDAAEL